MAKSRRVEDQKSRGHIAFGKDVEFFDLNGEVYMAPRYQGLNDVVHGTRHGRWEASRAHFDKYRHLYGLPPIRQGKKKGYGILLKGDVLAVDLGSGVPVFRERRRDAVAALSGLADWSREHARVVPVEMTPGDPPSFLVLSRSTGSNKAGWRGLSSGRGASSFDPRQLGRGTSAEAREHGLSRSVARRIAMDHLTEDPNYYSRSSNRAVPRNARKLKPSESFGLWLTPDPSDMSERVTLVFEDPSLSRVREEALPTAQGWGLPVTIRDDRFRGIIVVYPDGRTSKPGERAPGWTPSTRRHERSNHAGRAPSKRSIVIAWLTEEQEIARVGRADLGERHTFRPVLKPHAAMWKNDGDEEDYEKAIAHARQQGGGAVVYAYPSSEKDPLGRARAQILGKPGHLDVEGRNRAGRTRGYELKTSVDGDSYRHLSYEEEWDTLGHIRKPMELALAVATSIHAGAPIEARFVRVVELPSRRSWTYQVSTVAGLPGVTRVSSRHPAKKNRAGRRAPCRCPAYEFPHEVGSGSCAMRRAG